MKEIKLLPEVNADINILKLQLPVCLNVRPGVQWGSLDLDTLVAIMRHGAGWKQW